MKNLKEAKCLAVNCNLKFNCLRYTRKPEPFGDAYMNWTPYKKGIKKGKCDYIIKNDTLD